MTCATNCTSTHGDTSFWPTVTYAASRIIIRGTDLRDQQRELADLARADFSVERPYPPPGCRVVRLPEYTLRGKWRGSGAVAILDPLPTPERRARRPVGMERRWANPTVKLQERVRWAS